MTKLLSEQTKMSKLSIKKPSVSVFIMILSIVVLPDLRDINMNMMKNMNMNMLLFASE